MFDEKRWFTAGTETCVIDFRGYRLGLLICEDIWTDGPVDALKAAGTEIILTLNASPYSTDKIDTRMC